MLDKPKFEGVQVVHFGNAKYNSAWAGPDHTFLSGSISQQYFLENWITLKGFDFFFFLLRFKRKDSVWHFVQFGAP